jgi:hypothetical protein
MVRLITTSILLVGALGCATQKYWATESDGRSTHFYSNKRETSGVCLTDFYIGDVPNNSAKVEFYDQQVLTSLLPCKSSLAADFAASVDGKIAASAELISVLSQLRSSAMQSGFGPMIIDGRLKLFQVGLSSGRIFVKWATPVTLEVFQLSTTDMGKTVREDHFYEEVEDFQFRD